MSPEVVTFVLTAVVLPLAISEARDWCPRLAVALVRWAARRLGDPQARDRYIEEWAANIEAVPGKLSPLVSAFGYLLALPRMRWTLRRPSRPLHPAPMQLPAVGMPLVGRANELAALDNILLGAASEDPGRVGAPVAVIGGLAGVGKTALALHWAHRNKERFPDGTLYTSLQSSVPRRALAPIHVLGRFLQDLGVQPTHIPATVEERAALFRGMTAGRRMLVVLDDAVLLDQIRPLRPDNRRSAVLVTGRHWPSNLDIGCALALDRLTVDQAISLLRETIGAERVDVDPHAAEELVELCCCIPLAVRLAAEQMLCSQWTVARFVEEIRAAIDRCDVASGTGAIWTVFAWSYRALPTDARRMFRRLGALPGSRFESRQTAQLAEFDIQKTENLLAVLADAHLLTHADLDTGTYEIHDLVLTYARERLLAEEPSYRTDF